MAKRHVRRAVGAITGSRRLGAFLGLGCPNGPIGLIALRDTLRKETPEVLQRLRDLGIKSLVMITGDRKHKAEVLGAELGIDEVYAEMASEENGRYRTDAGSGP
ncbi:HAD family hydrolase [Candidatus Vondammii sp. HM_W22]|uniref:HAD family hydrolase n=1 Tax=Candidatus Vondammii sp. HM_W22 TaxID=2687299 RepID=UPI002A4E25B0|nr:HAD family hydrolase [Candidatus Vondammii sp. HM_W22]